MPTMRAATKCAQRGGEVAPDRSRPRKMPPGRGHEPFIGHQIGDIRRGRVGEAGPVGADWKGMMMPDTTPYLKETAKILVQNAEMRNHLSLAW